MPLSPRRRDDSPVRSAGFIAARSLIALQVEGARFDPSNIPPLTVSPLRARVIPPLPDSIRRFPSAQPGLCERDLAGRRGRVALIVAGFTPMRKVLPQLSSPRDLRFLSDFPLEICIMYITARPFQKWETYLDSRPPPPSRWRRLTFLSRCFFPFRLLLRLRDFI